MKWLGQLLKDIISIIGVLLDIVSPDKLRWSRGYPKRQVKQTDKQPGPALKKENDR